MKLMFQPSRLVSCNAKSFSPTCQGAVRETMPKSVGEYRPHASSGAPDARGHSPCPRGTAVWWGKRGLSWSLKSSREDMKGRGDPTSEVQGPGCTVTLRSWALGQRHPHSCILRYQHFTRCFESFNPSKCVTKAFIF